MHTRPYGNSNFSVPVLGLGAGQIGDASVDEQYAGYFLNQVVDLGLTLVDTARGYGLSEERIGRHLSWRRNDVILSTKVGYGMNGIPDWTYGCIVAGVHHALHLMRTDRIDICHLHSCPKEILERGEVITALHHMIRDGKIVTAAYSGEQDALEYALQSGGFGGLMSSVNMFDQRSIGTVVAQASDRSIGYIGKRPIGNAPWRFGSQPHGHYCEEYWKRMKAMRLEFGDAWTDIALRFAAYTPGVCSVIVGTTNLDHVKKNIDIIDKGALPDTLRQEIVRTFEQSDNHWTGQT